MEMKFVCLFVCLFFCNKTFDLVCFLYFSGVIAGADQELVRQQLKALRQTGRVAGYLHRVRELRYRLPTMTPEEAYAAFIDGLTPALRAQIGALTHGNLDAAMLLAKRMDLFQASFGGGASSSTAAAGGGGSGSGGGRRRGGRGQGGKGGGQGRAAEASAAESSGGTVDAVQGKGKA